MELGAVRRQRPGDPKMFVESVCVGGVVHKATEHQLVLEREPSVQYGKAGRQPAMDHTVRSLREASRLQLLLDWNGFTVDLTAGAKLVSPQISRSAGVAGTP